MLSFKVPNYVVNSSSRAFTCAYKSDNIESYALVSLCSSIVMEVLNLLVSVTNFTALLLLLLLSVFCIISLLKEIPKNNVDNKITKKNNFIFHNDKFFNELLNKKLQHSNV